ncbi:MAG: hypothetical protein HOC09_33375 [Deltaproteobacteria bacterium]|nr:hypothetical protein [Deltaproteobacteria bacterium]
MSQNDRILIHLLGGYKITPLDALQHFGCFRLAARIDELKKRGHNIISRPIRGKKYHEYYLAGDVA